MRSNIECSFGRLVAICSLALLAAGCDDRDVDTDVMSKDRIEGRAMHIDYVDRSFDIPMNYLTSGIIERRAPVGKVQSYGIRLFLPEFRGYRYLENREPAFKNTESVDVTRYAPGFNGTDIGLKFDRLKDSNLVVRSESLDQADLFAFTMVNAEYITLFVNSLDGDVTTLIRCGQSDPESDGVCRQETVSPGHEFLFTYNPVNLRQWSSLNVRISGLFESWSSAVN